MINPVSQKFDSRSKASLSPMEEDKNPSLPDDFWHSINEPEQEPLDKQHETGTNKASMSSNQETESDYETFRFKNFMSGTSIFCKHNHSCGFNCIAGTIKCTIQLAILKLGLDCVTTILSRKPVYETVIKQFFKYKNLGFSLSIGVFSGLYKLLLCLMRRIWNKDDYKNTLFASTIASLSILLDRSHSRRITMIYVILCRSFDNLKNIVC